ncbi:hypothetical protein [Streptomyces nojiriensis]|uniref:hypothetical protein n=1 Tax=Streptomyces nojiriensis TaxID=66374 RepID=UPI00399C1B3C
MGHDVDAALLATLVVGALRRARRAGEDLAEQARQADQANRSAVWSQPPGLPRQHLPGAVAGPAAR